MAIGSKEAFIGGRRGLVDKLAGYLFLCIKILLDQDVLFLLSTSRLEKVNDFEGRDWNEKERFSAACGTSSLF